MLSQGAVQLEEQSSHKELALTGIPGRNISYPLSVNPHVKDSLGKRIDLIQPIQLKLSWNAFLVNRRRESQQLGMHKEGEALRHATNLR